jgi:hypothetical protein
MRFEPFIIIFLTNIKKTEGLSFISEMSNINVTNIQIMNNPAPFTDPLTFQVTFECLKDLPEGKLFIFDVI